MVKQIHGVVSMVVIWLTLVSITHAQPAEESEAIEVSSEETVFRTQRGEQLEEQALLTQVILNHLTIWVRPRDGQRVYARQCRELTFGCEAQIAQYVKYIFEESHKQNFDPWLVAAVAWHESRFHPFTPSSAGAYGILQILQRSSWSRGLRFIRQQSYRQRCRNELGSCQRAVIERGIYWLKQSMTYCGTIRTGLRMYNSGQCNGPRRYPRAVFAFRDRFLSDAHDIRENNLAGN